MPIITEAMIKEAITLLEPTAKTMLRTKGLTWGPKYVKGSIKVPGISVVTFQFGTVADKWDPRWGEYKDFVKIAQRKRVLAERAKANTSTIVAGRPWILQRGDYLYGGGVYRDGISVGISGSYSRVDEALGEMLVDLTIMRAQLETDRRIAAKEALI